MPHGDRRTLWIVSLALLLLLLLLLFPLLLLVQILHWLGFLLDEVLSAATARSRSRRPCSSSARRGRARRAIGAGVGST